MGLVSTRSKDLVLIQEFKAAAERIAKMFAAEGVKVTPFHTPDLPHFAKLSNARKMGATTEIHAYLTSLEMVRSSGGALKDDHRALWSALKMFNVRPTSDLFDLLRKDYAIEVYNSEGIQIWRNFKFLEVCGYTLEEVFCYTWQERYKRDEIATAKILEVLGSMQAANPPKTVHAQIKNVLVETFSSDRFIIDVMHDYISPIMDMGQNFAGVIVLSEVKVLDQMAAAAAEEKPTGFVPTVIEGGGLDAH